MMLALVIDVITSPNQSQLRSEGVKYLFRGQSAKVFLQQGFGVLFIPSGLRVLGHYGKPPIAQQFHQRLMPYL